MQSLSFGLRLAALFAAYVVTARLGLELDAVGGFATLVWPPTGISLAVLVLFGRRWWPAITAGALVANAMAGAPIAVAAGIAAGNTLEAVAGAWMLEQRRFDPAIGRVRDAIDLVGAAILATSISAGIGVLSLRAGGVLETPVMDTMRAWWIGDMLGVLVVATFVMVWLRAPRPRRLVELAGIVAVTVAITLYVFDAVLPESTTVIRSPYFVFPPLLWATIRLGQRGATAATLVVWIAAIGATALGHGPFAADGLSAGLLPLQVFMAVVTITILVLGATVTERDTAIRARDEFLAVASHELRTPLATLSIAISDLRERASALPHDKLRARTDIIDRQTQRMTALVDNLLDVSRIMSGQFDLAREPARLGEIVADAVARFRDEASRVGSELRVAVAELPPVAIDRTRFEQIVTNLVGNALKFGAGKPIEIELGEADGSIVLRVRDQGIGIARRDQARIFERFERIDDKRGKGLGLGLWIVRQIVTAMGGSIAIESELGKGTELVVRLPAERVGPEREVGVATEPAAR